MVSLVAVLVMVTGRGGSESPVSSAVIGRSGGVLVAYAESGEEITLSIPEGAISTDTQISVSSRSVPFGTLAEMVGDDPLVLSALADYAMVSEDSLLHPIYGPLLVPRYSELAATVVELRPDGLQLDRSATLTLPAGDLRIGADDEFIVLVQSAGRWEVRDPSEVDSGSGQVAVEVDHFSSDMLVRIFGNIWDNPTVHPTRQAYATALDTLYNGPVETQAATIRRALACGTSPRFDAASVPSVDVLLDYLGFESTRISTAPPGASNRLTDQLRQLADTSRANGVDEPHNVDLGTLVAMAMNETNGDVFQALVLAHDVLRDNRDSPGVQGVMASVRGDGGDERGGRYHLLGMAIYAFAYEHQQRAGGVPIWVPSPETAASLEEAWVSGDINSDTVEYALDRYGARLGRTLFDDFGTAGDERRDLCEYLDIVTTTTTTTTTAPTTTPPSTAPTTTPPSTTTFSVAFGDPASPEGQQYIVSSANAVVSEEGNVIFWQPSVGAEDEAGAPVGTIVYRIPLPGTIRAGELRMTITTFHWYYSQGWASIDGSIDGVNWQPLAELQPPAIGESSSGGVDGPIPALFVGATEVWLRVSLWSAGVRAGEGGVWTNTSQHARYDRTLGGDTFRLVVELEP